MSARQEGAEAPADAARWVAELAERARSGGLPPELAEYVLQGAREGVTAAEAPATWGAVRLVPRVLGGVDRVDLATPLLGATHAAPVGVAPTTLQRAVHPEGERAVAAAAAATGLPVVVSSNAGTPFSEVGATGAHWWVQVYLPQDRSLALPLLERAVVAGARAVVLTVDTPVVGTKLAGGDRTVWDVVDPSSLRVNFDPGYDAQPGSAKARDLGAADVAWLGGRTGLPVVVKGVLHPDDACSAADAGAAAVWVSNHGGRQLDRAVSTAAALPQVARAVRGRRPDLPVLVDGGVRGGLDVAAALALGADAVLLGRAPLLALQLGRGGVERLLRAVVDETAEALLLAGSRTPADLRGTAAWTPRRSGDPGHGDPI